MDLQEIQKYVEREYYNLSDKVVERVLKGTITETQIEEVVRKGTVRKTEPDEITDGQFDKLVIHWRDWYVVVKNTRPPFIITAGGLD